MNEQHKTSVEERKKKTHSQNLNLLFNLVISEVFVLFSVYVSQFYSVFKTSLCA